MKRPVWIVLLFCSMSLPGYSAFCQNDDKVVVLSDRVGPEINREERDHFLLFRNIRDFQFASILQTPTMTYYARIRVGAAGRESRDTVVAYAESYLLSLSELIDHFEELKEGRYVMGSSTPKLQVVGGESVIRKEVSADVQIYRSKTQIEYDKLLPHVARGHRRPPFSTGAEFGVSISTYYPDFTTLAAAYRAIEEGYRQQGFPVRSRGSDYRISPLFWYSIDVLVTPVASLLFAAGRNFDKDPQFKAVSVTLLYHTSWLKDLPFQPFFGLGAGRFSFKTDQEYGDRIASDGRLLHAIVVEAATNGLNFLAGLEARVESTSICAYVSYLYAERVATGVGPAFLDLSSLGVGARINVKLF